MSQVQYSRQFRAAVSVDEAFLQRIYNCVKEYLPDADCVISIETDGHITLAANELTSPGDFRAQAEQAFLNIQGALKVAGGGFEHVVRLGHYFIDLRANFRMLRDIRAKYFDLSRQPASTMIQVGMLTREGALYEVDVVAVLPPA